MKEGAFALLDCLGFKGIWRSNEPDLGAKLWTEHRLIKRLKIADELRQKIEHLGAVQYSRTQSVRPEIRMLSDTIALSVQYESEDPPVDDKDRGYLLFLAASMVTIVQTHFIVDEPSLPLRGCISYGEHTVINNFLLGPAVDEAATYHELAEGAFVWLLPSASIQYEAWMATTAGMVDDLLLSHDLPLKGGAKLRCLVVNPLCYDSAEERRRIIDLHMKAMTGINRLDVWLKRQNTIDFLEIANIKTT